MTFISYLDASRSFLIRGGSAPSISIDFSTCFKISNFTLTIPNHRFEVEMEKRKRKEERNLSLKIYFLDCVLGIFSLSCFILFVSFHDMLL